jgi:3-phosphoshikimate 1-carboxyvinyltransferase
MLSGSAAQPIISRRSSGLSGTVQVPGDKSISHRSLILGAMAVGETVITGLLEGEDVLATANAMRQLGATLEREGKGVWHVHGVGVGGFTEPSRVIDCGNSGTGVRLIMGVVATAGFATTFTGDESLCSRPMGRVLDPLSKFGARARGRTNGRLPLTLQGTAMPTPVNYRLPVPSAQVKSAVLLAGLNAPGETVVVEPEATRDHTEKMLAGFGAPLRIDVDKDGARIICLEGRPELRPLSIAIPSDPSSAAFVVVAAAITPGSEILVKSVGMNPTRAGLFLTLQEMGADLTIENKRVEGGEPVADIRSRHSNLKGIEVPPERATSMIDEYPILSVAASFAEGRTTMCGVHELRVKETDRIAAMAVGLRDAGVVVDEEQDMMRVHGRGADGVIGGVTARAQLDHRIAMSFAVMGMASQQPIRVDDSNPINTSFPTFLRKMNKLGGDVDVEEVR